MIGLGTLINTAAIIVGGIFGRIFQKILNEKIQNTIMMTSGVCVIFIGIVGTVSKMLVVTDGAVETQGTLMMVLTLVLGALVGELLDIELGFERFGAWLRRITENEGDNRFLDGFLTASLTVSIGAMAVVGSIQDGILGDHSTLFAKSILDFVIVMIMASSMGKGCIFACIPVLVLQGAMTLLARVIEPIMNTQAISNISLVGSVMVACVGINLIWGKKIKVANLLPSLVFAVMAAYIHF